jgi:hypothetical protein
MGKQDEPLAKELEAAFEAAGVRYVRNFVRLDFLLPDNNVALEVMLTHSQKIDKRMSRYSNIILVQGADAVRWLADTVRKAALADKEGKDAPPA